MAPYGTGSFDLVIDRHALLNCIENNMDGAMYHHEYTATPINDTDHWTPIPS
jgi:hypothetical protein